MDNHPDDAQQPPRRRRRRPRPEGRWTNPASALQAARFDRRLSGKDVVIAIRTICPGHAGRPCKIDVAKLSDHETGHRRPGLTHIEAFARFYNKSPESLGLIKWRDDPTDDPTNNPAADLTNNHTNIHTLEDALDRSLQAATTLLAGLRADDLDLALDLDDGVTVDQVLLDLIAGTVALTAVATQVLRANLTDNPAAASGAII